MENNFKYIVYQTINIVNNKIYIGVHKTKDPSKFDGYIGNGVNINYPSTYMYPKWPFLKAVKKYGTSSFKRSVLYIFDTENEAYEKEKEIVTLEFIKRDDTYNLIRGGKIRPNYYYRQCIYQFDTDGNLLKKWQDVYEIADFIEVWKESVYSAIEHKRRLKGFYWAFEDNINLSEYSSPNNSRKVYKYDKNGKCIGIYESINSAAKKNNYKPAELYNRIKEGAFTKGNYYSLELFDEYIPKPKLSLKNKTIYIFNLQGELIGSGDLKYVKTILNITSNSAIYNGIKQHKPVKDLLLSLEDCIEPYTKTSNKKPVLIYYKNGTFVKECESIRQACLEFNLDSSTVNKVLKGTGKSTKGYILKYKN